MRIEREDGVVDGTRIVEVGSSPWQVENTRATIIVRNPALSRATLLDPNGMPVADVPVAKEGNALRVDLPANAMYVCVQ